LKDLLDLCRRMAAIPTSGGHGADRALLTLASKIDREAATPDTKEAAENLPLEPLT
jgi:hypothetical protein